MSSSKVKQAIDEVIGDKPLLNDPFVEKVLMKQQPKKSMQFLKPVIVFILMLTIGTVLYFTPPKTEHSAVEITQHYLTNEQTTLLEHYYTAILSKDKKALAKVATMSNDEVIERYKAFDLTKPLEVIKTIDTENELILYVKLQHTIQSYTLCEKLLLDKASNKFVLSDAYGFMYYDSEVELPKTFTLNYKIAPVATPMEKQNINLENADMQEINGNTLYQLKTQQGIRPIFETVSGERFDLGIVSEGMTYYSVDNNQFYFIDSVTMMMTHIYLNEYGKYQIVKGKVSKGNITKRLTEVYKEPFLVTDGDKPKIITIQDGRLIYANIFKPEELANPIEFYSTESIGTMLLVKYSDDIQQTSDYYELTSMNVLENIRMRDMLMAEPVHLQTMILTNRYKSQIRYQFDDGKLYYRNDSRLYYEKPKTEDEKPLSGELIEETYTNIKIETKDDQYFITGDNGFTWTLTRTAPRILQDEKGIEYTVPIDLDKLSESLR